jgi:hypothetical protein
MESSLRPPPHKLTDQDLVAEVQRLARLEQRAAAALVAHLVELDRRQLFVPAGYKSLFVYCVEALQLSEDAAQTRIIAARAGRQFPLVLELLASGALHLTAVRLLAPHLTAENHREALEAARHKTKREVELLVARIAPRPDVPAVVRKLPAPKTTPAPAAELPLRPAAACEAPVRPPSKATRPVVEPLSPARFMVRFTVGEDFQGKLTRAQELLGRRVAPGDLEAVFGKALELLVQKLEKEKNGATDRPRKNSQATKTGSRHIPAELRRVVVAKDAGQCTYVGLDGRRCTARSDLELHHIIAHALGGPTTLDNLTLRCRAHNRWQAEQDFGPWPDPQIARESTPSYGGADQRADRRSPVPEQVGCRAMNSWRPTEHPRSYERLIPERCSEPRRNGGRNVTGLDTADGRPTYPLVPVFLLRFLPTQIPEDPLKSSSAPSRRWGSRSCGCPTGRS